MGRQLTYSPAVFDVADEQAAKRIILTAERGGQSTDERWERETPYLADLIGTQVPMRQDMIVIDYGCGIGRMAKALIERWGCRVLGVDISPRMRELAVSYVASPRFMAVAPADLKAWADAGQRADAAISVWVLQHCARPQDDIALLDSALSAEAYLFIVNQKYRAVPTAEGVWGRDGLDVPELLASHFREFARGALRPDVVTPAVSGDTFWATYVR